jgi:hypothetical protein
MFWRLVKSTDEAALGSRKMELGRGFVQVDAELHSLPKPETSGPEPRRAQLPWQPISANLHLENSDLTSRLPGATVAPSSMPTRSCRSGLGPKPSHLSTPHPRLKPGASVILRGTPPPDSVPRAAPRPPPSCFARLQFLRRLVLPWGRTCFLQLPYASKHTVQGK